MRIIAEGADIKCETFIFHFPHVSHQQIIGINDYKCPKNTNHATGEAKA